MSLDFVSTTTEDLLYYLLKHSPPGEITEKHRMWEEGGVKLTALFD